MSSKYEKERQKQIQDKCQNLLTQMLKDDDNKYCVDCDAKGPRWASWNIGIFLCIRCAGIHRNLGVHISKVKSVNLDSWTPQQVVSLQQMGNSRARAVYEANLPDNFRRPQTDSSLEAFIRAKYEHKKYIAREWVQPPLPKVNWDKELEIEAEKLKKKKRESKPATNSMIRPLSSAGGVTVQALPKPTLNSNVNSQLSNSVTSQYTTDLLGLDTPTAESSNKNATSSNSDLFANFLNSSECQSSDTSNSIQNLNDSTSASVTNGTATTPTTGSMSRTAEEESFFNQPTTSLSNKQKQMTKDSILALYGNQSALQSKPQNVNGIPSSFLPGQLNSSSNLQNGSVAFNQQPFFNFNSQINSSSAFASNPFYPMAIASQIYAQKSANNSVSAILDTSVDAENQSTMTQRMGTMNLNASAASGNFMPQFNQPPSGHHLSQNKQYFAIPSQSQPAAPSHSLSTTGINNQCQ